MLPSNIHHLLISRQNELLPGQHAWGVCFLGHPQKMRCPLVFLEILTSARKKKGVPLIRAAVPVGWRLSRSCFRSSSFEFRSPGFCIAVTGLGASWSLKIPFLSCYPPQKKNKELGPWYLLRVNGKTLPPPIEATPPHRGKLSFSSPVVFFR